jgi:hypothetical protein
MPRCVFLYKSTLHPCNHTPSLNSSHEHQRVRRRRARHPYLRRRPPERQGSSTSPRDAPASVATCPRKSGGVVPFLRQPVRGAHRLPAEDRGLRARRRHRHGHSALPVPRPLGRVPGTSVSVVAPVLSHHHHVIFLRSQHCQRLNLRARNACRLFMAANAIAAGYLVLSLPFSATLVLRPQATGLRLLLVVCDMW